MLFFSAVFQALLSNGCESLPGQKQIPNYLQDPEEMKLYQETLHPASYNKNLSETLRRESQWECPRIIQAQFSNYSVANVLFFLPNQK